MIQKRIALLRQEMKKQGIDIYIVPTADFHQSEYVGEYFKCREYITGFTGSAGTAVFTQKEACLWTDGRYFIQAEKQLEGTKILLKKSGEPKVPTIEEYLETVVQMPGADTEEEKESLSVQNQEAQKHTTKLNPTVVGFDGRTVSIAAGKRYAEIVEKAGGSVRYDIDLVGEIWKDRPKMSCKPVFSLGIEYAGETVGSKLERLRQKMQGYGADVCVITGLDDIGWLLNLRGNDVAYCPLILSYAVVRMDRVEFYVDERKLSQEIRENLRQNRVELFPYEDIYERMKRFENEEKVLLDPEQMNYALYRNLPETVQRIEHENPVILMKAVKNETEIVNIRKAHLKDGIACTKFMYWLKQNIGKIQMTEISASGKLESLRREQEHFVGPSFEPICAYREHAAIVHYSATPETDVELKAEGMILCDTGGHYLEGSTDITRTIVLGELTEEEKTHFTTVLCGMLNLADVRFLYGCTGMSLDYAAREPFWRQNLNFNHGTGHGVGYLGNIHEPPARFFWRMPAGTPQTIPALEPGMVITDEPGIYIENSHGIRTENELLVTKGEANEYGRFLHFETLTFVPIDLDAVKPELMTEKERKLLNEYHKQVREKLSSYLTKEEREWLKVYTREI